MCLPLWLVGWGEHTSLALQAERQEGKRSTHSSVPLAKSVAPLQRKKEMNYPFPMNLSQVIYVKSDVHFAYYSAPIQERSTKSRAINAMGFPLMG